MGATSFDLATVTRVVIAVDGCLTATEMTVADDGSLGRSIDRRDLLAVRMAVMSGVTVVTVIDSDARGLRQCLERAGVVRFVTPAECGILRGEARGTTLCLAADVDAAPLMDGLGYVCCPSDAATDIKADADYVSRMAGGHGFVRDVVEQLLRSQQRWEECVKRLAYVG